MRGKLTVNVPLQAHLGITPAGAGKTLSDVDRDGNKKDHPRRCGENRRTRGGQQQRVGSPPQVRGKRKRRPQRSCWNGITPAGAGKTKRPSEVPSFLKDHPRRCGENLSMYSLADSPAGSPPQVRGKPNIHDVFNGTDRITPAGAGKTRSDSSEKCTKKDHPRRCGENSISPV